MPSGRSLTGELKPLLLSGWQSSAGHIAHYYRDGTSMCHRWFQTVLDKPAEGVRRCPECLDAMRHA